MQDKLSKIVELMQKDEISYAIQGLELFQSLDAPIAELLSHCGVKQQCIDSMLEEYQDPKEGLERDFSQRISDIKSDFSSFSNAAYIVLWVLGELAKNPKSWASRLHSLSMETTQIPDNFVHLINLQTYRCSGSLTQLPENFGFLPRLKNLEISYSELTELPSSFSLLQSLETLDLSRNTNFSFGNELCHLPNLSTLLLDKTNTVNSLEKYPLPKQLRVLSLKNIGMTTLSTQFCHLTNLHQFDVTGNPLKRILVNLSALKVDMEQWQRCHSDIIQMSSLQYLDLSNCEIQNLPDDFALLQNLRHLNLYRNNLSTIPDCVCSLTNLRYLQIARNGTIGYFRGYEVLDKSLLTIPDSIGNLRELRYLELQAGEFTCLPETLCELTNLEKLYINQNRLLESLPENFGNLKSLQKLLAYRSAFSKLPDSFTSLHCLQEVDFSDNPITKLPDDIGRMSTLKKIDINNTHITALPESFYHLFHRYHLDENDKPNFEFTLRCCDHLEPLVAFHQLRGVFEDSTRNQLITQLNYTNFSELPLKEIPDSISHLKNLESIAISNFHLSSLPPSIGKLSKLRSLTLAKNKFTNFPRSISTISSLTHINLSYNSFRTVSDLLLLLPSLRELVLNENQIDTFPTWIWEHKNLQRLSLEFNQLSMIPDLQEKPQSQLRTLHIRGNQLVSLTSSLANLSSLQELDISFNQIVDKPAWLQDTTISNIDATGNPFCKETAKQHPLVKLLKSKREITTEDIEAALPELSDVQAMILSMYIGRAKEKGMTADEIIEDLKNTTDKQ